MYLFFENHTNSEGVVLATDCICSSHVSGIGVDWKHDRDLLEAVARLFKTTIPIPERTFNNKTNIWTFIGSAGAQVLIALQTAFGKTKKITFIEVEDLEGQLKAGGIKPVTTSRFDPKKFFYNSDIVAKPALTREMVIEPLSKLMQIDANVLRSSDKASMKSAYRKASLRLHPDRNSGDGSKMSELNMYWSVYA